MIDESLDTEFLNKEPQPWEFRSKPIWQRDRYFRRCHDESSSCHFYFLGNNFSPGQNDSSGDGNRLCNTK